MAEPGGNLGSVAGVDSALDRVQKPGQFWGKSFILQKGDARPGLALVPLLLNAV